MNGLYLLFSKSVLHLLLMSFSLFCVIVESLDDDLCSFPQQISQCRPVLAVHNALEQSDRGEYVLHYFLDVGNIMRENGKAETHEAVEVLPMSTRGVEPREFKKQKL